MGIGKNGSIVLPHLTISEEGKTAFTPVGIGKTVLFTPIGRGRTVSFSRPRPDEDRTIAHFS